MRSPPLPPDAMGDDLRALHDDMSAVVEQHLKGFVSRRADGALVGPFPALLHAPRFGAPAWELTKALIRHATLPAPVREVAILATGAAFQCRYELYAHERVARAAGLSDSKVAAVAAGQRPADLTDEEAAAYDVAAALASGRALPDGAYGRAVARFGEAGAAELVFLVGHYCLVSVLLNAYDAPVPGREEGTPESAA